MDLIDRYLDVRAAAAAAGPARDDKIAAELRDVLMTRREEKTEALGERGAADRNSATR